MKYSVTVLYLETNSTSGLPQSQSSPSSRRPLPHSAVPITSEGDGWFLRQTPPPRRIKFSKYVSLHWLNLGEPLWRNMIYSLGKSFLCKKKNIFTTQPMTVNVSWHTSSIKNKVFVEKVYPAFAAIMQVFPSQLQLSLSWFIPRLWPISWATTVEKNVNSLFLYCKNKRKLLTKINHFSSMILKLTNWAPWPQTPVEALK